MRYTSPVLACLTFLFVMLPMMAYESGTSHGALVYNFERSVSKTVLATMEIESLPADHSQVNYFTLKLAGGAILGYSTEYTLRFNSTSTTAGGELPYVRDDGIGGLTSALNQASVNFVNTNPRTSSRHDSGQGTDLLLTRIGFGSGGDSIEVWPNNAAADPIVKVFGDWKLVTAVPEPSLTGLLVVGALGFLGAGQLKRRTRLSKG